MSINNWIVLMLSLPIVSMAQSSNDSCRVELSGQATDADGLPVVGASIALHQSGKVIGGTVADDAGTFQLTQAVSCGERLQVVYSAVGYAIDSIPLLQSDQPLVLQCVLRQSIPDVGSQTIYPDQQATLSQTNISHATLLARAQRSLVPNNLTAAINAPQISRPGSIHSSQLRISGTNPRYTLNGVSLGVDPDHYGMFSLLPASVMKSIELDVSGTSAEFGQPAAIRLSTPAPFGRGSKLGGNISSIDANLLFRYGARDLYLLGSLRKSLLDELAKRAPVAYDRHTIPPTNFGDLFVSAGWKVTAHEHIAVDQLYAKDRLAFHSREVIGTAAKTSGEQQSQEQLTSLRLQSVRGGWLLNSSVGYRHDEKLYRAAPAEAAAVRSDLRLDLAEQSRTFSVATSISRENRSSQISLGATADFTLERMMRLRQQNWNVKPPFSSDDNLLIYQEAVNALYGEIDLRQRDNQQAAFLSVNKSFGPLQTEQGIRLERFSSLAQRAVVVWRSGVNFRLLPKTTLALFGGTFVESPATSVLETNQAIIRTALGALSPIRTTEFNAGISHGTVRTHVSWKKHTNLPVITPDFAYAPTSELFDARFLRVESIGSASFFTASCELTETDLISNRLTVAGSYAFSRGTRSSHAITTPHEQDSPHRFRAELGWKINRSWSLHMEGIIRSGLPYTATRDDAPADLASYYSEQYYLHARANELGERFPMAGYLNLSGEYRFAKGAAFASISNLTNRANPVVSTVNGLIYDAGILPTVGIRWNF